MPCYKCNNGKWKYGKHGKCVFDTLEKCRAAEVAIIIGDKKGHETCPPDWDCSAKTEHVDLSAELDKVLGKS